MRFTLLTVGKLKFPFWQAAQDHYLKNIAHFEPLNLVELKDHAGDMAKEGEHLLKAWAKLKSNGATRLVIMDETGKSLGSQSLALEMSKWRDQGIRDAVFIVGGPFGIAPEVKAEANFTLSLSAMTLPHDLARVVLLEQLYRVLHIQSGSKYHHP
jgi:23S rRNA (pseudouridine1915-N3)-methyltransferase